MKHKKKISFQFSLSISDFPPILLFLHISQDVQVLLCLDTGSMYRNRTEKKVKYKAQALPSIKYTFHIFLSQGPKEKREAPEFIMTHFTKQHTFFKTYSYDRYGIGLRKWTKHNPWSEKLKIVHAMLTSL